MAARREKEGEVASTSVEFEFHLQFPCGSPATELSDLRQSVFLIDFSMQIFKFQGRSCKLSLLFGPRRQIALESLLSGEGRGGGGGGVGCFTSLIFFEIKREICIFDVINMTCGRLVPTRH